MESLKDLTKETLEKEFDRLADLRDECQASMAAIRDEKSRRLDAEIEKLRANV